tara:strand:- start:252 stop:593 length:342 start_codon:yes stop_codon:yes gene_type:complete
MVRALGCLAKSRTTLLAVGWVGAYCCPGRVACAWFAGAGWLAAGLAAALRLVVVRLVVRLVVVGLAALVVALVVVVVVVRFAIFGPLRFALLGGGGLWLATAANHTYNLPCCG